MQPNHDRDHDTRSRRYVLRTLGVVGAVGLAGCGAVSTDDTDGGDRDDETETRPGICEIHVYSTADEDTRPFDVTVTVQRDGETVYDRTHEFGADGAVVLTRDGVDWLGDEVPYRVTVASAGASEPAVYDTASDATFDSCHSYLAFADGSGVTGGPWSGTSEPARNASDDSSA